MSDTNPFFRRYIIAGLLVGAAVLFAAATTMEKDKADTHQSEAGLEDNEGSEAHDKDSDEKLFGVNLESTPFVVLGVSLSLGLAFMVITKWGNPILALVILFATAFLLLDLRETFNQIGDTNWKLAGLAIATAIAHFGAIALSFRGRVSGN